MLLVTQNFWGSPEECGQRGLNVCYFCFNSALSAFQICVMGTVAEIDRLELPSYCWKNVRITAFVRNPQLWSALTTYLLNECGTMLALFIYLSHGLPGHLKGTGNVLPLYKVFQTALNNMWAMILTSGLREITWEAVIIRTVVCCCSLEAVSLRPLGWGDTRYWLLQTTCCSYQVQWITGQSERT